jgi:hypothetical protein
MNKVKKSYAIAPAYAGAPIRLLHPEIQECQKLRNVLNNSMSGVVNAGFRTGTGVFTYRISML